MKKTKFNELHKGYDAKMVEFAGYEMPIQYPKGIIHEHKKVRESVGMFDVSHMGEFEVSGKDALNYIQKITLNDASKLQPGKAQYTAMCYNDAGMVDDLLLYMIDENKYMMVVNASNIDKDFAWCEENRGDFDVELKNISDEISLIAVQGPNSIKTLQKITEENLEEIPFYNFKEGKIAGVNAILSRTGYTGEIGFEIYFRGTVDEAEKVWKEIENAGKEFDIEPVGLGSRDTLRLEKGYCLYGNDIDQTTNPIEASLGWITKVDKGDFKGRDIIVKVKEEKPSRKLVGFISDAEKFIPRKGYKIYCNGVECGVVTSGNISPSISKPIGLGYVSFEHRKPGTKIEIEARGKKFLAEVKKLPLA